MANIPYIEDYIQLSVTTNTGNYPIVFDNDEVRSKVEWTDGRGTKIFISENGNCTSIPSKEPCSFKFTLRVFEKGYYIGSAWTKPGNNTRVKYDALKRIVTGEFGSYSIVATISEWVSALIPHNPGGVTLADILTMGSPNNTGKLETTPLVISNAVLKIKTDSVDKLHRGVGLAYEEIEIEVCCNNCNYEFPEAPPSMLLGCGDTINDLGNFKNGDPAEDIGSDILKMEGLALDDMGNPCPPAAGALMRFYFWECSNKTGLPTPLPGPLDYIEIDYSSDWDAASVIPSGGTPTALTWFSTWFQPHVTGGTGVYAADGTANSGEITLYLDKDSYANATGNTDHDATEICVQAELEKNGITGARASSKFPKMIQAPDYAGVRAVPFYQNQPSTGRGRIFNITSVKGFSLINIEIKVDDTIIATGTSWLDPVNYAGPTPKLLSGFTGTMADFNFDFTAISGPAVFPIEVTVTYEDDITLIQQDTYFRSYIAVVTAVQSMGGIAIALANPQSVNLAPDDLDVQAYPSLNIAGGFTLPFINPTVTDGVVSQAVSPYINYAYNSAVLDFDCDDPAVRLVRHTFEAYNSNTAQNHEARCEVLTKLRVI